MQLSLINNLDTSKKYQKSYRGKTAGLFSAASVLGGIITKQKQSTLKDLSLFGNYLGIAFQILDDVLDYDVLPRVSGKIGDDFERKIVHMIAYNKSNKKKNSEKSYRGT